jgi:U3 small nucleolar ribonucleoprotein protein IMP3
MRRYHIQGRDDYSKYNNICGTITKTVAKLKTLPAEDEYRIEKASQLLAKLYEMGVISNTTNLASCEKISVSSFCRRRLPVVLVKLHMAQSVSKAVELVEQGHVKVGVDTITDPAFHVNRSMEDHIGWVKTSKIRKKVIEYNGEYDDFDING